MKTSSISEKVLSYLKRVPLVNRLIKSSADKKIISYLDERVPSANRLIEWMKKNKIKMAGSFPLQMELGEFWEGSDIDLYILDTLEPSIIKPPSDKYKSTVENEFNPIYTYETQDILRIDNWVCTKNDRDIKVQLIYLNNSKYGSIEQFVDRFDLDFCKIVFDGHTLKAMKPESVKNKTSRYNRVSDWRNKRKERIAKYTTRGFKVIE